MDGEDEDLHSRYIEAFINGVVIACLYLPNGNPWPGSSSIISCDGCSPLQDHADMLRTFGLPVALIGDHNVMPSDLDTYKPLKYVKNALFRPESKAAFKALVDSG